MTDLDGLAQAVRKQCDKVDKLMDGRNANREFGSKEQFEQELKLERAMIKLRHLERKYWKEKLAIDAKIIPLG
jgi:hypothetical protein